MEIILGLIGVLAVVGMATGIFYCFVYSYHEIDDLGLFDSIKNKYLKVLLIIVAQIAAYSAIIGVSYLAGGYVLEYVTQLIAK